MRLLSYNISYGGVGREESLARVIEASAPDLVVLQEATDPSVVGRLARASGMRQWAAQPGYSLAYMSRIPVVEHAWRAAVRRKRSFLELVVPDASLRVYGVHLSAIHANWMERRRVRELEALFATIADRRREPHVLVGDFNTLAPGERLDVGRLPPRLRPLVWLSGGAIRWQTIQIMLDEGYVDAYRRLHPQADGFTFPSWDPHIRLDYVFVPAAFAARVSVCDVARNGTDAARASDHLPLGAEIAAPLAERPVVDSR